MTIYELIELLQAKKIHFTLATHRHGTIMATAAVPGERWEIEIFRDGSVELEIFEGDGELHDEGFLIKRLSELVD